MPARNNFLNPSHLHVVLLENFILLDERVSHFALLSSRFSCCSQLLDSCSQVDTQRFYTVCPRHSFFTALTQLVLQEATRRNHLALSFPFSVAIWGLLFRLLLSTSSSPSLPFQPLLCLSDQDSRDVIHKTLNFNGGNSL